SESSLKHFDTDDCRFLVMEVTGRQLSYAGKQQEAIEWLERALNCDAFRHSLWRRNVLITMAELHGPRDPRKAAEFTAEAVRISKDGTFVTFRRTCGPLRLSRAPSRVRRAFRSNGSRPTYQSLQFAIHHAGRRST